MRLLLIPALRLRSAATVAALVSALTLAGCSSSPASSSNPGRILQDAAVKTVAANSATVGVDVSVTGTPSISGSTVGAGALNLSITGSGVFDFAQKTGQMTIAVPSIAGSGAHTLDIRLLGSTLYLGSSLLAPLDGGKQWVKVDLSDYLQKQSQSVGPLGGFSDGDPTQILNLLKQVSGDVHQIGTAQIGGVATTEYGGTIDLASGGTTGSTIVSSQMAQSLGLTNLPVDVWVDAAGRARQVRTSFGLLGLTVAATETLGNFGAPVNVTAPPSADTADGSALLQSGKLGNLLT
ncbi:MAG: hypothetical protein ACYDD4_12365 [Acidimicrobiales bacterium]